MVSGFLDVVDFVSTIFDTDGCDLPLAFLGKTPRNMSNRCRSVHGDLTDRFPRKAVTRMATLGKL